MAGHDIEEKGIIKINTKDIRPNFRRSLQGRDKNRFCCTQFDRVNCICSGPAQIDMIVPSSVGVRSTYDSG